MKSISTTSTAIRDKGDRPAMPRALRHSDVRVVELPEMGVNWPSLLRANAALIEDGWTEILDFFDVGMYVPERQRHVRFWLCGPRRRAMSGSPRSNETIAVYE